MKAVACTCHYFCIATSDIISAHRVRMLESFRAAELLHVQKLLPNVLHPGSTSIGHAVARRVGFCSGTELLELAASVGNW